MMVSHTGPCAAGVDVGTLLNVVIGHRAGAKKAKIVKVARVSSFNDVHDLFTRFNVKSVVFDLKPETRKVREFCQAVPYPAYGCVYSEEQRGDASWDDNNNVVAVNRTEILDATHNMVTSPGGLELPRKSNEVEVYAKQMCNTAKVLEEHPKTGVKTYRYKGKVGGPDDYRHATNYFKLACEFVRPIITRAAGASKYRKPTTSAYAL